MKSWLLLIAIVLLALVMFGQCSVTSSLNQKIDNQSSYLSALSNQISDLKKAPLWDKIFGGK